MTIRDIAAAINESGVALERRFVSLDKPIKYLGVYPVSLSLHPEVSQTILVNVARTADEAKKQAKAYNNEGTAEKKEAAPKAVKAEEPKAEAEATPATEAEEKPAPKKRGRPKKVVAE